LREDMAFYRALTVPATITTSFTPPPEYAPANLVDGDASTYFWGCRAAEAGDYIALDFGCPRRVGRIAIDDSRYAADYAADLFRETFRGRLNASDYIHYGRLEYSLDGKEWIVLGKTRLGMPVDFSMPPTSMRFLRLVVTEPQVHWPAVFGLEVEVENMEIAETEPR